MKKGETGKLGEMAAAQFLRKKGYQILCANYRTRVGEIDLIASDNRYIIFAEVKTRSQDSLGFPREAVDKNKQQKIIRAAGIYIEQYGMELQPRFDVLEIITARKVKFEVLSINHLENAFSLD